MQTNVATARNVLLQTAPAGSWVIQTKINVSELTTSGEQAGLMLWQSEGTNNNTFAKVVWINKGGVWHFESFPTRASAGAWEQTADRSDFPTDVYMRIRSSGTGTYFAEGSLDGEDWQQIGSPITNLGNPSTMKVGLKVSNGSASTHGALFDYFRVDCSDRVPPTTTATSVPAAADGQLAWYKTAPTVTLIDRRGGLEHALPGRRQG